MAIKIGIRPATIVIKDNKVLLVKSKYNNEEFYLFPSGGIEYQETIQDTAIRETFEETGVKVKIKELFHVNEYINNSDWDQRSVSIFFLAEVLEISKPTTNDQGKIKKIVWIDLNEIDKYDIRPKKVIDLIKAKNNSNNKIKNYSIDFKNIIK